MPQRSTASRPSWVPYGILAVALLLTLIGARGMARLEQAKEKARFENAAERTQQQFQQVINGNLILLDGLRGLAAAKLGMGPEQFQAYVDALQLRQHYPGVQGMGFAWGMTQEGKAANIEKARKDNPTFHIWPDSDRNEFVPILYLAPADARNTAALGYDLYSDPTNRPAMEHAAATGQTTASPVFAASSPAAGKKWTGFLLLAPAYYTGHVPPIAAERMSQLYGLVFCSFDLEDFFQVFSAARAAPEITFQIFDGREADAAHLLYDSRPPDARGPGKYPVLSRTLAVADRTWTVAFSKHQEFIKGSGYALHPFIVLCGTVVSFLLFGLALAQAKGRTAAEEHAEVQRLAEARFRRLVEQSLVGIYVIQDDRFAYGNPKMAEILGCTLEELSSQPVFDFIAEDSRALVKENLEKRLQGEAESIHYMLHGLRKDGRVVDLEAHGGRTEYNGRPAILGCLMDITERKQAEQKLRAQLSRLDLLSRTTRAIAERQDLASILQVVIRSLEDHLPVDFCCVGLYSDADKTLTVTGVGEHSAALAMELAMTEQARIDIDQNGLSRCVRGQLVYEPELSQMAFPFPQRLAGGGLQSMVAAPLLVESKVFGVLIAARRAAQGFSSGECEFLRQLSEHVALASHQAQLYRELQQAYDELRQTQQVVMQQERLRALGEMASGIAHDINNAISPVVLYTESLLEKEPNLSERARDNLQTIRQSIQGVAETVARMREFSRPREPQLTLVPVDLNRLVPQVVDLTRARWSVVPQEQGIVIALRTELAGELPAVMGAESEIRDALTNLIFNAVDAMPGGGTLTLRTGTAEEASGPVGFLQRVYVEAADTGAGMDEDTRRRCLEPFFTTKGERGTGLGLAMVYGMAKRHGGDVRIESAIGQGTTVRLSFPVPSEASAEIVHSSGISVVPSRLRILVVDDDPVVLHSLRQTLESDGHVVVTANDGQKGLDAFRQAQESGESFAVVITDLGMPRVDGRQVASEIKAGSPSTPVILHTGWGERLVAEGQVSPHVDYVLSKPPKLHELRAALAHCCPPAKA
ncbi:MAG: CHASE domain-containing protein [Chthoniobacter sp.]|uniref:CHASE domain-containing protein n=1 Tax=Chthoniobacter sp. TaxID=2510640 RepID=UPI0032A4D653